VTAGFRIAVLVVGALLLAACGGGHSRSATSPILTGSPQNVAFSEVRSDVDALYRSHPGVALFTVRHVAYTPAARDRVLGVCRNGGAALDAQQLETSRIEACAPLIFFFDRYGRQASAADATDLARKLYWYAATSVTGPFDARGTLRALLRSWGVE
jgi:hypothetical protein